MNATKITHNFIQRHNRPRNQREWIKGVFGIMLKVARRNSTFSMDDIWMELDKAYAKGMKNPDIDHRILGPMLRHMVAEDLIASSNYYVKSTRPGGGSRPITVWYSNIYKRSRVAA